MVAQQNQMRHAALRYQHSSRHEADVREILTGDTESFGGKQWRDSLPGKAPKLPLDDLSRAEFRIRHYLRVSANFIQNIHGQPGFAFVFVGDTMDGSHSLGLASSSEEVLGRLVEMEEEETTDKHEKGKCTESNGEVPPPSVVGAVAASNTWSRNGTGLE